MDTRPLRKQDFTAITKLFSRAYPEWNEEMAREYLTKFWHFEPQSCLVGVEDGTIVGAILGYSWERPDDLVLYIQELFVDPDYRGKGYGKALVAKLRKSFAGNPFVKVRPLVKADTKVLNFYNSLGFESEQSTSFFFDED
ncbi:MAG: GNAT family N-acetyltransferase [Myxococcales bacterium]|nr:GNAT family N-acetyltransferase [Myxococcales bacterium]